MERTSLLRLASSGLTCALALASGAVQAQQPDTTDAAETTEAERLAKPAPPEPRWTVPNDLRDASEGNIPAALDRWSQLRGSPNYSFGEYARFLITYPGWPDSRAMREFAERASDIDSYSQSTIVAYFDRLPPLTNSGRATYALALRNAGRHEEAEKWARKAWRGGPLSEIEQARLLGGFSGTLTPADHDMRMDALVTTGAVDAADRQLAWTSDERRAAFAAALAYRRGFEGAELSGIALSDPTYLAQRADYLTDNWRSPEARRMLANRPPLTRRPYDAEEWYEVLLAAARGAENDGQYELAYQIASKIDDALPDDADVSAMELGVRDDYTSLAWLAGRVALEKISRPREAIAMFASYGNAARTPQTRSKGFYWAARAAKAAGDDQARAHWLEQTAQYPDYFYGMLALGEMGQPLPEYARAALPPTNAVIDSSQLYMAARLADRHGGWDTQTAFIRAVANGAESEAEHRKALTLSAFLGRPDLAVMTGRNARVEGYDSMIANGYPVIAIPESERARGNFTLAHAIMRQESQFDTMAVSHAGARGLMQLMPATAREVSRQLGLSYDGANLNHDSAYNIRLGSSYISRMLGYYDGNLVLAVASYNAGPGNVNKWLRENGDPRQGVDVITWIEDIPIYETKNYVQRVLENLVMYDTLYPNEARRLGERKLEGYLGL